MSLFFGLNISLKGMMAQQNALTVVSHNIANANTDGYSRQRVCLEASEPISGIVNAGQMGSGVDVEDIARVRDGFLDYQVRKETSSLNSQTSMSETLQQVATVFNESSDSGLNQALANFWNGWQALANTPESTTVRTSLVEGSITLTDSLHQLRDQLTDIQSDISTQINIKIQDVNSISSRITKLNDQIVNITLAGNKPNDLLDARDNALDQLAAIGNITVSDILDANGKPTGAVEVKLGTNTIVDAGGCHTINVSDINQSTVSDGSLAGLLKAGGTDNDPNTIQYYLDKLDALAAGIAKSVNDIHQTGTDLNGGAGEDFFVFRDADGNPTTDLGAGTIHVNPDIQNDVAKIAASKSSSIPLKGNGDIALKIADLKDAPSSGLGNLTIASFYQDMVTELGSEVNVAKKNVTNQQTLLDQLASKKESIQGVSLDEESTSMLLYQHAYDANAKMISVIDQMLDTLLNIKA